MPTFKELLHVAELTVHDKTSGKRARDISGILRKNKAFSGLTPEKAVSILEDLGPTFVKMGQLASNRSDMLPKEYCDALAALRTKVPPMPFETVISQIEEAYGCTWSEVFSEIEEKPLGSASIAQVHRGRLSDGPVVAIKVQRPGIAQQMAEDIMLMKHLLALAELGPASGDGIMVTLDDLVSELERTTCDEIDFTIELKNLVRFYAECRQLYLVASPLPYPEFSTETVLVMEFATGTFIDRTDELRAQGVSLKAIGERLAKSYVTQIIDNGFFHADPHPGNVMVERGSIIWIDLGMTGTLTSGDRALISQMFKGIALHDAFELKQALLGLAKAQGEVNHSLLLDQIDSMLNSYASAGLSDINIGMALMDVIEVLRSQNLRMPSSFTMLARGLLTLEGVLIDLDPTISIVDVVSSHLKHQAFKPANIKAKTEEMLMSTLNSAEAATKIPAQVSQALDMLERGQMRVSADMKFPDSTLKAFYGIGNRLALALISAGLFLGSSILCTTAMEPRFLGVPLLGVLGYMGALVLGVYVIWQAWFTRRQIKKDKKD